MFKEKDITQLFLNVARVIIITLDASGVVTFINQGGCEILGFKEKGALGKNWIDNFVPERSKKDFKSGISSLLSGEKDRVPYFECPVLTRQANEIIIGWGCLAIKNCAGSVTGVFCYGINITQQRQAEAALEESKGKLENIFHSAYDSIIITDLKGIITETNNRVEEVLGITKSEMIGKIIWDFVDESDRDRAKGAWHKLVENGYIKGLEYHIKANGGFHIIGEVNASVLRDKSNKLFGYLFLIRDITAHKRIEEQLKRSELQVRKIFDAITDGVALVDPDGTVINANESGARILGLKSPLELKGKYFLNPNWKYLSSDGTALPVKKTSIMTAMKRKHDIRNVVTGIVKENGSVLWYFVSAVPIIEKADKVLGAVLTMTDITEQKKLWDENQQYIAQITKAREEDRKRIAQELHEEIAQSLALLTLELDALTKKGENIQAEMIAAMKKLREMASHTLDEVRSYSHELRPSMLDNLGLTAALEYLVDESNKGGEVKATFNTFGSVRRLPADTEVTLFRIVQGALLSVCKYSQATRADIKIRYTPHRVRLTITDNGKGADMSHYANGGLDLISLKELAKSIGAIVKIKSALGKGTTVWVEAQQ